ncbi:hypothetical protein V3F56_13315 [Moorellaceae bacterium AZ2]
MEQEIVHLNKYHHYQDEELLPYFPPGLLPMHRLFRLLDGLSAGVTRRGPMVSLTARGAVVQVREESTTRPIIAGWSWTSARAGRR